MVGKSDWENINLFKRKNDFGKKNECSKQLKFLIFVLLTEKTVMANNAGFLEGKADMNYSMKTGDGCGRATFCPNSLMLFCNAGKQPNCPKI